MKIRRRDERVQADGEVLSATLKRATIDFVQWTDDASTARIREADWNINRQGHRATLHDVTARVLASLPAPLLARPIAGLEVSIDFYPKRVSDDERVAALRGIYDVLHRRLAPWGAPNFDPSMRRAAERGSQHCVMTSGRPLCEIDPTGQAWTRTAPKQSLVLPQVEGNDILRSHTLYFGERIVPSWAPRRTTRRTVQLRMYVKTKDRGAGLPRDQWRVRLEVTLNGPALLDAIGVTTLGDLQSVNLRPLATRYLRLAQPLEAPGPKLIRRARTPVAALVNRRAVDLARKDASDATRNGNFTLAEDGLVEFRTVPELTRHVTSPLREFQRTVQRARNVGIQQPVRSQDEGQVIDFAGC